jgi:hypothetical protein
MSSLPSEEEERLIQVYHWLRTSITTFAEVFTSAHVTYFSALHRLSAADAE